MNHIDGNKLNNDVHNLEWVTQSENCSHYRNMPVKNPSLTSGRTGRLYHKTDLIGSFRSLQQAKLFCKKNFGCPLSTINTQNINIKHQLFYLRDSLNESIDDVYERFLIQRVETQKSVINSVKEHKGTGGDVYKKGVWIGHFKSVREAKKYFNCEFKKKGSLYCARDNMNFIPS